MSVIALVLVGMSIWQTIEVSVTEKGFSAKLDQLADSVEKVDQRAQSTARRLEVLETEVETIDKRFRISVPEGAPKDELHRVAEQLSEYSNYLKRIGFERKLPPIDVRIQASASTSSSYDSASFRIDLN